MHKPIFTAEDFFLDDGPVHMRPFDEYPTREQECANMANDKIQPLIAALEFYADITNWISDGKYTGVSHHQAREAIKEVRKTQWLLTW